MQIDQSGEEFIIMTRGEERGVEIWDWICQNQLISLNEPTSLVKGNLKLLFSLSLSVSLNPSLLSQLDLIKYLERTSVFFNECSVLSPFLSDANFTMDDETIY